MVSVGMCFLILGIVLFFVARGLGIDFFPTIGSSVPTGLGGILIGVAGSPSKGLPHGIPELVVVGFVLVAVGMIVFVVGAIKATKKKNVFKKALATTTYRMEEDILYVDRRSVHAAALLSIRNHDSLYISGYVPEKIHVGAVTVGGVTTGGVYKTGGYNEYVSGADGKCRLFYLDKEVKKIALTPDLVSEAEKSEIKDFIKESAIVVVDEVKYSDAFYALMSMGRTTEAHNVAELDKADAYPSAGKCEAIIRWLSQ